MKRLYKTHNTSKPGWVGKWSAARLRHGESKYGEAHLQRYGVVDIMEELIDAKNIAGLLLCRVVCSELTAEQRTKICEAVTLLNRSLEHTGLYLRQLDELLPDELCTDEQGGDRIWWNEQEGE